MNTIELILTAMMIIVCLIFSIPVWLMQLEWTVDLIKIVFKFVKNKVIYKIKQTLWKRPTNYLTYN